MVEIATQAALDSGKAIRYDAIAMALGSGVYGFNSGVDTITWNTIDFVGAGSIIEIPVIVQSPNIEENTLSIIMRAIPDTNLTPDVLAGIESEEYHRKPVIVYQIFIDPTDRTVLSVEIVGRYLIDQIVHVDSGDSFHLEFQCNDRFREHRNVNYRVRTDADQRLIDADDKGLEFVADIPDELVEFGTSPKKQGLFARLFPRIAALIQNIRGG